MSTLNGPGEAAVQNREVGGEGVTYDALLREGRPRIARVIGPRKTISQRIRQRRIFKIEIQSDKMDGKVTSDRNCFK